MAKIDAFLELLIDRGGSDLHLSTGYHPCIRIDGEMTFLREYERVTNESNRDIIYEITPERNIEEFGQCSDTDFAYELDDNSRFRVNVFEDQHGIGTVLRLIPSKIPTLDDLNMPDAIRRFCFLSKGLVIITGPTGSGKSTTLAAMIDLINRSRKEHIITIEDPIEFLHRSKGCLINQREVHSHTQSFSVSLRAALREDPDIVLVGEMRDLETIEMAIETAETGHLVFGTLHTNTAATTVDRMIDKFPSDRQNQIRTMLADTLCGIVAQTLCKKKAGGRIAATEILIVTPAIASNIREGKTHQIPSAMQTGKSLGMQMFNDCLYQFVVDGIITPHEAYLKAIEKDLLATKLKEMGIEIDLNLLDVFIPGDENDIENEPDPEVDAVYAEIKDALSRDPNDVVALQRLALLMAAHRNPKARNGTQALKVGKQLVQRSGPPDAMNYIALAAAQAENELFDEALSTLKQGIKAAKTSKQKDCIKEIQEHMGLYKKRQPLRV
jgi:twitching motility protein PilT